MKFLLSKAPLEKKTKALLEANGTLLDATFLNRLKHLPQSIADQAVIAA